MKNIFLTFTCYLFLHQLIANPCTQHPLFNTFPGFEQSHCEARDFDQLRIRRDIESFDYEYENKEGFYLETWYNYTGDWNNSPSNHHIFSNYINAVTVKGGKVIYQSKGTVVLNVMSAGDNWWVEVTSDGSGSYTLKVLKEKNMTQDIMLTAEEMERDLMSEGKAIFYGIYFEHDKSDVKEESMPALFEMAKFLNAHPGLKVYIVGHTDNSGSLAYNLNLSEKRAYTVKELLISKFGIQASRIESGGVGPLCPVKSNKNDDGKSLNRRVEMVLQ